MPEFAYQAKAQRFMFLRGVLGYLPVQAVQGLVGFGSVVVFTRLLTPEQYGQYALAFTAAALVHSGLLSWIEAAMERFTLAESDRGDVRSHFVTLHCSFAALAVLAIAAVTLALVALPLERSLETAIAWAAAAAVIRGGLNLIQQRRKAEGRVFAYALNDILCVGGGFALGVLLAELGWGGAAPAAGLAVAAVLLLLAAGWTEVRRGRGGRFEPARARRYALYGLPISAGLILAVVIAGTDRVLIAAFLSQAQAGAYHAGYSLAHRTLDILFIWLGLAGVPATIAALERGGREAMEPAARAQAQLMVLITLPAAVGLATIARPLAELMVGEELRAPAQRVIPWIAAAGWFSGFKAYYLDQAFTLGRRPGLMLIGTALPAVLNVILNLLLIPRFGLDGAMIATTASMMVGAAASYAVGTRVLRLPLPWLTVIRCGLSAWGMALAVHYTPAIGGAAELLLKAGVGAVAYGLLVLLLDGAGARSRAAALLGSRLRRAAQPDST